MQHRPGASAATASCSNPKPRTCDQSKYFEKAFSVLLSESKTGEFHFTDTEGSPYAYWRTLEYTYRGTYSEKTFIVEAAGPGFQYRIVHEGMLLR